MSSCIEVGVGFPSCPASAGLTRSAWPRTHICEDSMRTLIARTVHATLAVAGKQPQRTQRSRRIDCSACSAVALLVVLSWSVAAQQPSSTLVTPQDLRDGLTNPTRWLTYSGNYGNHRHSPLTQI